MKSKPEHSESDDWDAVESPPLSDDLLKRMRPVREKHLGRPRHITGPPETAKKVLLSIGLTPEVEEYFKAKGPDWQSRMDDALKDWIATHPLP